MRQTRPNRKISKSQLRFIVAEALENRRLLSALPDPQAIPANDAIPQTLSKPGNASPSGFTPTQLSAAYGINNVKFNGITGNGAGQTIAIIGAYDNPMLVDTGSAGFATSDLHNFDAAMGIADPPSFTKVDQNGGNSYPSTNPFWANESALDVEWTHALAPQANILLIECDSTNLSNLIEGGAQYASQAPGVSVVTMSFKVSEFAGETSYDSFLQSPTGHGITFVAASGDDGSPGSYPAFSPSVVSVGATTLTLSGNNYVSETGWNAGDGVNSSGGGISAYESKPSYQFGVSQGPAARTNPDVSFDGDPNTSVPVYDSFNGGPSTPWYKIGGTSFSAPAFAALLAITNQGRAQLGLTSLDGETQTLPRLYSVSSSDFHDITSGNNNGFSAGSGYDLVTGRGTPIADKLIPDLAGGNSVTGTVFVDSNGNGTQDINETGLAGVSVFTDVYNNGIFEGADQQITSTANGSFNLSDLPGGTYHLAATTPSGYRLTTSSGLSEMGSFGSTSANKNFGFKATAIAAKLAFDSISSSPTAGAVITPAITVKVVDSTGNLVASDNSPVTLSVATGSAALGGTLTVDAINGIASFSNLSLSTAGPVTLLATDGSLTSASSNTISVRGSPIPPAGSILAFGQQPTNTSGGLIVTPPITVDVESPTGSILTSDGSTVTLALASGAGTLGGTLTVAAVNGVAMFTDITVSPIGDYTLTASDSTLTPITSNPFAILAIPGQVAFAQQPTATNAGAVIAPAIVVDVLDGSGQVVTTDSSTVTIAIATGTGTLGGTLTEPAVNGVATFSDITISTPGAFTLTATDALLSSATSSGFVVNVPGSLTPTLLRNSLAPALVAGSKVHSTVAITEINNAANSSTGMITTNVFATINGSKTLLATSSKKLVLKAKKNFAVSLPIKFIPATLNGTYTLQIEVVDTHGLTQTFNGPTFIVKPPFIALSEVLTKLTLLPAVVGGAKTKASATLKITNNGNIPSTGLTTTRIYLSPDGTINSAELINSVSRPLVIKPGASALVKVALTQIPAVLNGVLNLLAQVTDPNAIRTFVDTGSQVKVGAPFVKFSATFGAPIPATVAPGKSASVTITLANSGNTPATGPATIVIGLTSDQVNPLPGSTTIVRTVTILPGKSTVLHLKISIPATLTARQYFPYLSFQQAGTGVVVVGTIAVTVS